MTNYILQGLGIFLPLALCLLNRKIINNKDQVSIKQIIQECLIKIKKHKHTIHKLAVLPNEQKILQPFQYVRNIGGKQIRLCMSVLLSEMFSQQLDQKVLQIGGLIEFLHTASLIIDDIEDGSILRRDQPCSHLVFGMDRSINAANLIYFLPFRNLLQSFQQEQKKKKIIQYFVEQMVTSHLGQAEDVLVHKLQRKQDLPSLDEYFRLISAKTSSLLRMMVKMIGLVVNISQQNSETFTKIMNFIGISFQITDDILNLRQGMGKGIVAEDLHQKKFTIIVHFLRNHSQFMEEFIHPKKSEQSIHRMLQIIEQQDVISKCRKIAQQFSEQALKQVKNIKCPHSKQRFNKLVQFIVARDR